MITFYLLQVVIYAGPNTSSRKLAEYGGNTFGYGSRSVLGSGWPKDLVKVEGDTVTITFEMRSGREHNTPDKAMWGFLITVRAQVGKLLHLFVFVYLLEQGDNNAHHCSGTTVPERNLDDDDKQLLISNPSKQILLVKQIDEKSIS